MTENKTTPPSAAAIVEAIRSPHTSLQLAIDLVDDFAIMHQAIGASQGYKESYDCILKKLETFK